MQQLYIVTQIIIKTLKKVKNDLLIFNSNINDNSFVLGIGKDSAILFNQYLKSVNQELECQLFSDKKEDENLNLLVGGHPLLNKSSFENGNKILEIMSGLESKTKLIVLLSGGASAIVEVCNPYFTESEVIEINHQLIYSGASIEEINLIRGEVSLIKNGGLAMLSPDVVNVFIINDIPSEKIHLVGSGAFIYCENNKTEIKKYVSKYLKENIALKMNAWLDSDERMKFTQKKKMSLSNKSIVISELANGTHLSNILDEVINQQNINSLSFNESLNDSVKVGVEKYLKRMLEINISKSWCLFSTGELSVQVIGSGKGGRNTEFVLRLGKEIFEKNIFSFSNEELNKMIICSYATDGKDNISGSAGGYLTFGKYQQAIKLELSLDDYLQRNDSFTYLNRINCILPMLENSLNLMDIRFIFYLEN
ncbi:MAG: DUF4147 domain-containing protein [Bdellovibrionales bacterium]|jgi:glycerate 2-kinase|nr:DUF4147 domain-containing protein [Bdellovibrionales bacterium]